MVKNVAGFDLTRLAIGSWGTLGIITSVSARLFPIPETDVSLVLLGAGTASLLSATGSMIQSPLPIASMELLDPFYKSVVIPQLLIRSHGTHNLMLAQEAAMPMNGHINILAL